MGRKKSTLLSKFANAGENALGIVSDSGYAEGGDEKPTLFSKFVSAGADVVDKGIQATASAATVLGGVTVVAASEGAKLLTEADHALGFTSEEERDAALANLDIMTAAGKGAALGGALGFVDVVTTAPDTRKNEKADSLLDMFYSDAAESYGDTVFIAKTMADEERGIYSSQEDLEAQRAAIGKIEDEALLALFVGATVVMIPQIRAALILATPAVIATVFNAIRTGGALSLALLGLLPGGDEDTDEEESEEETVEDPEPETEETEDETLALQEQQNDMDDPEEVPDKPFFAGDDPDDSNIWQTLETVY